MDSKCMNNPDIDQQLKQLAGNPLPEIPQHFQQDVWREIRHRKATQALTWSERLDSMLALLLQPTPDCAFPITRSDLRGGCLVQVFK